MTIMRSRRLWLTVGGGLAVLLVSIAAGLLILRHEHASQAPPAASTGGLVVEMGRPDDAKPDPTTPLRCFVNGQFIGMDTLADCAKKNGVATQALDVGVDSAGALAAASVAGSNLSPLPPEAAQAADVPDGAPVDATVQPQREPTGDCLRYVGGEWRKVSDALSLSACVQALFAGRCERLGGASFGRWMGQTLRLAPHEVDISNDNKSFRTLTEQSDADCSITDF